MKKFNIILLVIWMIVIFLFSNQTAIESTKTSKRFTKIGINVINVITGNKISKEKAKQIVKETFILVRKLAHITEYLILGILVVNVVKDYKKIIREIIMISLLFCILYSCSDEIHQLFIIGRSGQVLDVLIDTIGIIIGITIYSIFSRKIKKNVEIS